jgi:hypothetical protein
MWEFLAKAGGYLTAGVKSVAAGKSQADLGLQSPHLPGAMVRIGRFGYSTFAGWVVFSWYTAYVNQRVAIEDSWITKFVPPGSLTKPVISPPDRPDRSVTSVFGSVFSSTSSGILGPAGEAAESVIEDGAKALGVANVGSVPTKGRTLVRLSASQLGVPGTAVEGFLWSAPDGQKQIPPYNAARYRELLNVAQRIGSMFGLKMTSGYRPNSTGANGQLDLHSSGLAFDFVGRETDERRAATWAAKNPGIFQEVFIHNEGSGMHLHLGMYPDAAQVLNSKTTTYSRATSTTPRAV